jgi:hypothetical protein
MIYNRLHCRFQTVLKGCARSKKNAMQSILNNYLLLETSLNCRLTSEFDWTVTPAGSTTASYLLKPDSADKKERMYHVKGKATAGVLSDAHFKMLLDIWGRHNDDFGELLARFKEAQGRERRHANHRANPRKAATLTLLEWVLRTDKLTSKERRWARMTPLVQVCVPICTQ